MTEPLHVESWRAVWRNGFLPTFSPESLYQLGLILKNDDPKLTQGSTTTPPPLMCVQDWPCEAADAIGTIGVFSAGGYGEATVGTVEEFFARACFKADQRMGEPAACRWFLNWFDDTPRNEMRRELLAEVVLGLVQKGDIEEACRLASDTSADMPLDILADWLEDHERFDLVAPLRNHLTKSTEPVPQ